MLGAEKVMIPMELVMEFQKNNLEKCFQRLKRTTYEHMKKISKTLGTNSIGLVKVLPEIFETYGIGVLNIIEINEEKANMIVKNPIKIDDIKKDVFMSALFEGMFAYIYEEDNIDLKLEMELDGIRVLVKKRGK